MAGPTTFKITVANFFANVVTAAAFSANVELRSTTTANTLNATGNVSFNTTSYFTANNMIVKRTVTPANSTDGANSSLVGLMWADSNNIYFQANATHIKKVALTTF